MERVEENQDDGPSNQHQGTLWAANPVDGVVIMYVLHYLSLLTPFRWRLLPWGVHLSILSISRFTSFMSLCLFAGMIDRAFL